MLLASVFRLRSSVFQLPSSNFRLPSSSYYLLFPASSLDIKIRANKNHHKIFYLRGPCHCQWQLQKYHHNINIDKVKYYSANFYQHRYSGVSGACDSAKQIERKRKHQQDKHHHIIRRDAIADELLVGGVEQQQLSRKQQCRQHHGAGD